MGLGIRDSRAVAPSGRARRPQGLEPVAHRAPRHVEHAPVAEELELRRRKIEPAGGARVVLRRPMAISTSRRCRVRAATRRERWRESVGARPRLHPRVRPLWSADEVNWTPVLFGSGVFGYRSNRRASPAGLRLLSATTDLHPLRRLRPVLRGTDSARVARRRAEQHRSDYHADKSDASPGSAFAPSRRPVSPTALALCALFRRHRVRIRSPRSRTSRRFCSAPRPLDGCAAVTTAGRLLREIVSVAVAYSSNCSGSRGHLAARGARCGGAARSRASPPRTVATGRGGRSGG